MCLAQPAAGAGAAGGGPLDFLRTNPQFIALRQIVQSNPMILQPMLQARTVPDSMYAHASVPHNLLCEGNPKSEAGCCLQLFPMCKRHCLATACLGCCALAEGWSSLPVAAVESACCCLFWKGSICPYKTHQESLTTMKSGAMGL